MPKKSTPVVRVPGFSRDELRLVDRAAKARKLSRAAYLREAGLVDARWLLEGGSGSRIRPDATVASNSSGLALNRTGHFPADGGFVHTVAMCKLCGGVGLKHKPACPARPSLAPSFTPEAQG